MTSETKTIGPILIVDDDEDIREALSETLEHRGFAVAAASNGRHALEILRRAAVQPAAIVLDIMMPEMDGYAFLHEQRNDPALASIPVIVATAGHALDEGRLGALTILRKPLDITELTRALEQLRPQDVEREPGRTAAATDEKRAAVAEEQFRLLVDSVRDYAIFLLDVEGRVVSWNAGARAIKRYEPEEIIGRHISVFYAPEDREAGRPARLLKEAAAEGRVEDEGWRVRRDGTRFWADVVITALRDLSGKLIGFAKVTRDLTSRRAAEERLRQAESRLAATLSSIGDGVLATDETGRVTMLNPVAEHLTGWTEAQASGRPVDEVFNIVNEETRARALNPIARVLTEGIVVGLANHTSLIARDGAEHPIADSGAPIRDSEGVTRGAVLVFRDVTQERRAEERLRQSEERLRLMIDSIGEYAVFMLDDEGRVVTWNSGAERIKGYKSEEIVGQSFSRFFTADDVAAGKPKQELELAAQHGRFEIEGWRVRKDGSRFWANIVVSAVRHASGELLGFTKVTRDLTERRTAEGERLRLAQAQEALRLRDEFLSIASHELKTPLTALQLQLQGALDRIEPVDEKAAHKLDKALRAGKRLGDLIETLLDVSRIATGRLTLAHEQADLASIAREVVDRVHESAERAGCEVSVTAEPVLLACDRLRIEQILTNLLSNAFKYAAGGPVQVVVRSEDDAGVIEVQDSGEGVAAADRSRIFERFERSDNNDRGGLGLGLYVARQMAEAHGGMLSVMNRHPHGACFRLRLPLSPAGRDTVG